MAGVGVEPTTFVTTDEVADALGYYEREVIDGREDYLSESGTSPGQWVGSLAAADGYAGVAQRDHLARAFSGVHPDGFKMTAHDLTVPGFDMTLSPSKSLSLLWALGSDDDARSVEQGLYAARREVERFLEADGCFVRRGHAGASVEHGSGFFGAVFMHRTSRLGDPGIHLHWTVFNVTEGPDGRRTALDARHLYRLRYTAEAVFQATLRRELVQRLGVVFDEIDRHGFAEIVGISADMRKAFSGRRAQIIAEMDRRGVHSGNGARVAALATRKAKPVGVTETELREGWRQKALDHSFDLSRVPRIARATALSVSDDELSWRSRTSTRRSTDPTRSELVPMLADKEHRSTRSSPALTRSLLLRWRSSSARVAGQLRRSSTSNDRWLMSPRHLDETHWSPTHSAFVRRWRRGRRGLIGGMIGVHWLAANLAAYVTHRRWPISLSDSVIALAALPRHLGEPRLAFPASIRADLAGPVIYWVSVVTLLVIVLTLAVVIGSKVAGTRTEAVNRRRRLGVATQPALATTKDLAPLFVRRPGPDRLVLLPYRRGWLATESPTATKPRGIQGAVALFGASQSGKTTALVSSITHWSGPAVVCSVKTDLMRLTIDAARSRGDVKVFDPLGISGMPTTRWSPLRAAKTLEGASAAASLLMHSAGEGTGNDRFWRGQAEQLLTGMLWAAANLDGHTMANVVSWVLNLDIPDDAGRGTLAPLVRLLRDSADPQVALEATEIDGWLWGQWKTDRRTTSSVYATARDAIWPWANPRVRASAAGCDIDLDWLTNGSNTLYLCAPLGDHKNGVIFSAVLQDIIDQVFARANLGQPAVPRLLLCVDETANTPLWKLPEWASTLTATGTQLITVWQSKAQMDELFGHHADTLLTNHRTKLIFPSGLSDMTTARFISDLVGDEAVRSEIEDRRLLTAAGSRRSPGDRSPASSTPFLPPHVLRSAQAGDALVIHGNLPPAWVPVPSKRR